MAANARVQQGNFTLSGLRGFEVRGKTIGIVGTGAAVYHDSLIFSVTAGHRAVFASRETRMCCNTAEALLVCRRYWHSSRSHLERLWDPGSRL